MPSGSSSQRPEDHRNTQEDRHQDTHRDVTSLPPGRRRPADGGTCCEGKDPAGTAGRDCNRPGRAGEENHCEGGGGGGGGVGGRGVGLADNAALNASVQEDGVVSWEDPNGVTRTAVLDPDGSGRLYFGPRRYDPETGALLVNWRADFAPGELSEAAGEQADSSPPSGTAGDPPAPSIPMRADQLLSSAEEATHNAETGVDDVESVYLGRRRYNPVTGALLVNWLEDHVDAEPAGSAGGAFGSSAAEAASSASTSVLVSDEPRFSAANHGAGGVSPRPQPMQDEDSREKEECQRATNTSTAEDSCTCASGAGSRSRANLPLSQEELAAKVREINADSSLSSAERDLRRQALFSAPFDERKRRDVENARLALLSATGRSFSSVKDPETGDLLLGCEHYPRKCKIKAACCNEFFGCRLCHDEMTDHKIDRFATKTILCMGCNVEQPIAEKCSTVGCTAGRFARYFCSVCKFYDDTPDKNIYHCDDCGICRVGKGIGVDNFHCPKCNACISMESKDNHKCLSTSLDSDCPICHEYLFTSTKPVVYMLCGHTMHSHCFEIYTQKYYACPICKRALTDMAAYYRQIDIIMQQNERANQLPPEYVKRRSRILCNDCSARTTTRFDFVYHKCQVEGCGSYNTQVLGTFDVEVSDDEDGVDAMDDEPSDSEGADTGAVGEPQSVEVENDGLAGDTDVDMETERSAC